MPIRLFGMNHVSAPLEVRERVTFDPGDLETADRRLREVAGVREAMILSTCNRTEILVSAPPEATDRALCHWLAAERSIGEDDLDRHCYLHTDDQAIRHLFRTASSLDSMVVGEAQILGQVKEAYASAVRAGTVGPVLDALMQKAFSVAKKVRSETGLARYPVSISHAAVNLARDIFGDLRDNGILIVGAGKMARLAAQHLLGGGAASVVVVNRTFQGAASLAEELGGRAAPWDRMFEEMEKADIVICSTAAPHHVVRYEDAHRIARQRRGRPLFLIDIALPRDVEPRVNQIDNVYVYDIDDLQGVANAGLAGRRQEALLAEQIVERETSAYVQWLRAQEVTPTIVALRERLHGLGSAELERFRGQLAGLSPEQQKAVEELTASLINKVLHGPTVALKRTAALNGGGGLRVRLLRQMFGLDPVDDADDEPPTDAR